MKLRLVAVGTRSPDWVHAGYSEYEKRMPPESQLQLVEIPPSNRTRQSLAKGRSEEGAKMLEKIKNGDWVVALDVEGRTCSTQMLSKKLDDWRMRGGDVIFLIGGADGLDPACLARANEKLSLSALTFPHYLVRVLVAEQLYRAWTLLTGHPYHRG